MPEEHLCGALSTVTTREGMQTRRSSARAASPRMRKKHSSWVAHVFDFISPVASSTAIDSLQYLTEWPPVQPKQQLYAAAHIEKHVYCTKSGLPRDGRGIKPPYFLYSHHPPARTPGCTTWCACAPCFATLKKACGRRPYSFDSSSTLLVL